MMILLILNFLWLKIFCVHNQDIQNQNWDNCKCGLNPVYPKIYGGDKANENEFGWAASLFYKDYFCTATIIGSKYLISASHCFTNEILNAIENIKIVVGSKNLNKKTNYYEVKDIYIYKRTTEATQYDIIIIEIKGELPLTNKVYPICLHSLELNKEIIKLKKKIKINLISKNEVSSRMFYTPAFQWTFGFINFNRVFDTIRQTYNQIRAQTGCIYNFISRSIRSTFYNNNSRNSKYQKTTNLDIAHQQNLNNTKNETEFSIKSRKELENYVKKMVGSYKKGVYNDEYMDKKMLQVIGWGISEYSGALYDTNLRKVFIKQVDCHNYYIDYRKVMFNKMYICAFDKKRYL